MLRYNNDIQADSRPFVADRTRYGLLSYTTRNLGDFIQSIAARKFLPKVDQYIDRECLNEVHSPDGKPVKLIMNGWFCHRPDKWPPASFIRPLLISVHITNNPEPGSGVRAREEFARSPQVLNFLRQNGPVGARDHDTLAWLRSLDVDVYYSGCLTLTLDRPPVARESFIALNELPEAMARRIECTSAGSIRRITHIDNSAELTADRLRRTIGLIETYAKASCVVTTRLHSALPCLAMGTPVLLVDASWDQSRFTGLRDLLHHCSVDQFMSGAFDYDVDDPPPNPDKHLKMRDELERKVRAFAGASRHSVDALCQT
jgi:hypothetical protein